MSDEWDIRQSPPPICCPAPAFGQRRAHGSKQPPSLRAIAGRVATVFHSELRKNRDLERSTDAKETVIRSSIRTCGRRARARHTLQALFWGRVVFGGERPGKFIWFAHPKGEDSLLAQA